MITILGILVGLLVFVLLAPRPERRGDAARRIAALYSMETARSLSTLPPESLDYKLLAAGLPLQPVSFRLILVAAGLAAAVLGWVFLPGLPALMLGLLGAYLPYAWLDVKVKSRAREIDRHLPVAIGRIAAGLLAGGSLAEVLQKTGESLDSEGPNPLGPELLLSAAELRSKERQGVLRALAARSPSTSLANVANLLEGYSEAGGGKYTDALLDITQRVQQILVARNRAVAKAADALLSARIIPVVLLVVFVYLTQDPLIRSGLTSVSVQFVVALGILFMAGGYWLMQSIVAEAV